MNKPWTIVRTETRPDGRTIDLWYAEFGKGRAKTKSWKIFCGNEQLDYAVNEPDADENFRRAVITGKGRKES